MHFDIANRLFFRLYQCSNLLHKNGTRSVEDFGATTQQWAVLGALSRPALREKGMSVKDLIAFLLLSRQNLSAVIDRLEARRWVCRITDPEDGRSRLIRLTPEGESLWQQMQSKIELFYQVALADLSDADQAQLHQMLDRLKDGLNRA